MFFIGGLSLKSFILFLTFALIQCAYAKQAITYCIQSDHGAKCSATLLRVDGKCHLVTNAHCVSDGSKAVKISSAQNFIPKVDNTLLNIQRTLSSNSRFSTRELLNRNVVWDYEKHFFDETFENDLNAQIKVFDTSKDLALLEVPVELQAGACKQLNLDWNYDLESVKRSSQGVVAVGCTRENSEKEHHPKVSYSKHTYFDTAKGEPNFSPAEIESVPSAYKDSEELYYIRDILATPGQSGGTSYTSTGGFLGLQTRANLTQDRIWVIPAKDVIAYIRAPSASNAPNPYETMGRELIGDTDGTGTGDTDGTGTGDTDGTGTGDTDGTGTGDTDGTGTGDTDGTGTGDACHFIDSSLEHFSSRENVFLENIGDILISLDGKILNEPGEIVQYGRDAIRIKRDEDGYLPLEIRKNILKGLTGQFTFNESIHKRARRETQGTEWSTTEYAELESSIGIKETNDNNYSITFDMSTHVTKVPSIQFISQISVGVYSKNETYKASYTNDYKTIILKRGNETLTCDNKHYLKLFCQGANKSISISASTPSDVKQNLKYRYVNANDSVTDYYYGERD